MKLRNTLLAIGLAGAFAACGSETTEEPTTTEPVAEEVETPEVEEPTALTEEDLPIPDDFEDEASEQINADNLEEELAALEGELEADDE